MKIRALIFGIFVCFVFSCAHAPKGGIELGKDLGPDVVLERIKLDNLSRQSIRARVKIEMRVGQDVVSAVNEIAVLKPRSIRIETYGDFGVLLSVFVSDGEKIIFARLGEDVVFEGEATDDNFRKYFIIYETLFDLATLLVGGIPIIEYETYEVERTRKDISINLKSTELNQDLLLRGLTSARPVALKVSDTSGMVIREVKWLKFDRKNFPVKLFLSYPIVDTSMNVHFTRYEMNPSFPDETFTYTPPPGTEVIAIGEEG